MDINLSIFLKLMFILSIVNGEVNDSPLVLKLYHNLGDGLESENWTPSGTILMNEINVGHLPPLHVKFNESETTQIQELASVNGIFRLKAIVKTEKGKELTLFSFGKACTLLDEDPKLPLTVHFDQAGSVLGINVVPKYFCSSDSFSHVEKLTIQLPLTFKFIETGPIPDTTTYVQKLEKEREAKEKGQGQDHRSFLAKYWMYIVPVLLFVVLSGAANGDGAAPGS